MLSCGVGSCPVSVGWDDQIGNWRGDLWVQWVGPLVRSWMVSLLPPRWWRPGSGPCHKSGWRGSMRRFHVHVNRRFPRIPRTYARRYTYTSIPKHGIAKSRVKIGFDLSRARVRQPSSRVHLCIGLSQSYNCFSKEHYMCVKSSA